MSAETLPRVSLEMTSEFKGTKGARAVLWDIRELLLQVAWNGHLFDPINTLTRGFFFERD